MFYISKTTPLFVMVSYLYLLLSFFYIHNHKAWAYLTIYGFLQSVIIGVLYQIGPNSQNQKLKYEKFTYIILVMVATYCLPIILGLFKIANVLIFLATLLFSLHIITVFKNIKPITVRFLSVGILYINISSSILFLSNFFNIPYQLAIHTFTIGVLINTVIGIQFTWIPMLTMKNINLNLSKKIFYLMFGSTITFLLSFVSLDFNLIIISGILIFFNILLFLHTVYKPVFSNITLNIPIVVNYFLVGWVFFILGFFWIVYTVLRLDFSYLTFHKIFMVYGFGVFTVIGGTVHIIPRIVWNYKYIKRNIPQINKIIEEKALVYSFFIILTVLVINIFSNTISPLISFILTAVALTWIFSKVIKLYFL